MDRTINADCRALERAFSKVGKRPARGIHGQNGHASAGIHEEVSRLSTHDDIDDDVRTGPRKWHRPTLRGSGSGAGQDQKQRASESSSGGHASWNGWRCMAISESYVKKESRAIGKKFRRTGHRERDADFQC